MDDMDTNLAAWMIAGGPRIDLQATQRDREQLYALRESRKAEHVGWMDRILGRSRPRTVEIDLVCCPA
jgi:hypothetical protein